MAIEFGKLESVNLRSVWAHEATDFTPWLAENLHYISDAIGIQLEPLETEASVERFSADILAFNPTDNSRVLIENQLELSDHSHLGQMLTYLAGLGARTVIWVASGFTNPHLDAIHWLNENTAADFSFFAVSVLVVKIGDSQLAPLFNVLEQPSDWERQIPDADQTDREDARAESQMDRELTPLGNFRRDFWTHYAERHPNDGVRRGFAGSNPVIPVRGTDFTIKLFHERRDRVGMWVAGPGGNGHTLKYEELMPYLPALEQALGIDPDKSRSRESAHIQVSINIANPDNWQQAADWLHERLEIYRRILSPPPEAQE